VENKLVKANLYKLSKDPTKTYIAPLAKESVPYLDFSELENSLVQLKGLAEEYQKIYSNGTQLHIEKQNQLNGILFNAERSLISEKGLPRREWYKHQIYAPGFHTGYGVKTLPAIREAIEQRNWKEAQEGINTVSQTIKMYNTQVQEAVNLLGKPAF
jgi:N-acetylated-alpha-linked acidic dipeptidase